MVRDHGTETFERVLASPGHVWQVMPEHYAVCRRCAELPPCAHETRESEIDAETARLEDLLRMAPGDCLGCGQPITDRMRYTRFPGPNLWRPDLPDDSAVVHARAACRPWAQKYHRAWASIVAPTRSR
ncbi:hypothetical protein ACFZBU_41955 [Embleya sp. NPDC008237]|uniref:hypothetical protein n=1 Tax=Embleya sp. NPDC008237 TaxID=3363978 RepID=UPI0036E27847